MEKLVTKKIETPVGVKKEELETYIYAGLEDLIKTYYKEELEVEMDFNSYITIAQITTKAYGKIVNGIMKSIE